MSEFTKFVIFSHFEIKVILYIALSASIGWVSFFYIYVSFNKPPKWLDEKSFKTSYYYTVKVDRSISFLDIGKDDDTKLQTKALSKLKHLFYKSFKKNILESYNIKKLNLKIDNMIQKKIDNYKFNLTRVDFYKDLTRFKLYALYTLTDIEIERFRTILFSEVSLKILELEEDSQ